METTVETLVSYFSANKTISLIPAGAELASDVRISNFKRRWNVKARANANRILIIDINIAGSQIDFRILKVWLVNASPILPPTMTWMILLAWIGNLGKSFLVSFHIEIKKTEPRTTPSGKPVEKPIMAPTNPSTNTINHGFDFSKTLTEITTFLMPIFDWLLLLTNLHISFPPY
jgi:hypothetical protein